MIMIRKLIRIVTGKKSQTDPPQAARGRLKLRPRMMELEARELLSTFTGNDTVHHGDQHLPANSAHVDGGLPNHGSMTGHDVASRSNTIPLGSGLAGAHDVTDARRVHSRRAATDTIVSQTFDGTGFPSNWQQFLPGTVAQAPTTYLTITDTSGNSAGIASTVKGLPFNVQGVQTTMTAQISNISVSPHVGNAIIGLLGPNGTLYPGELAAGIDGQGNVFIVEYDPAQKLQQPNVSVVGSVTGYTGNSPVTLTLTVNSAGVSITTVASNVTTNFGPFKFSSMYLNNFSVKSAFIEGAVPALVGASQPGDKGGAASFQSITVTTAPQGVKLTRGRAGHGGRRARG
jgi:hypothetical protein